MAAAASAERRPTPIVGAAYSVTPEFRIVPVVVRESERPTGEGACVTSYLEPELFHPGGWYIEARNVLSGQHFRMFLPFDPKREAWL